jgi:hypothetical protein
VPRIGGPKWPRYITRWSGLTLTFCAEIWPTPCALLYPIRQCQTAESYVALWKLRRARSHRRLNYTATTMNVSP